MFVDSEGKSLKTNEDLTTIEDLPCRRPAKILASLLKARAGEEGLGFRAGVSA